VIEEQVFRLQVSMHDAKFMEVFNAADDLLEKFACLWFLELLLLHDVVKEFTSTHELHNQEELFRGLDDLEQLDNVGMSDHLEDVNFTRDALDICVTNDFRLFKNFDGDLRKIEI
jgi:hypothetical protein